MDGVAKKKFRSVGGGREIRTLQVWETLFQWFVDVRTSLKAQLPKGLFLYKVRHFMQIGCNSIHIHLRKNSSSSQTKRSGAENLNMESLCDTQINVIQFPKKTAALAYKIT